MDRLHAMGVFARVARLGGFAAAARELRLSTTAVSRTVGQLEDHLRVRLLRRTTRRVSLTEAGAVYLERCERILCDLYELEESLPAGQQNPRGMLRVSAGVSFAQEQLNALMPAFLSTYKEMQVELLLSDQHVDLIRDRIDVAVRIGRLSDSGLFAKRICAVHTDLCASPAYVAEHGALNKPSELAAHACIVDTNRSSDWTFTAQGKTVHHAPDGRYRVNSAHAARDAAEAGLGLAYLPSFVAAPALARGTLVAQLTDYATDEVALYAVYPESRYLSAGVRAFIDALVEAYGGDEPPWATVRSGG